MTRDVEKLWERIEALEALCAKQAKTIAALEARLKATSSTSSKPPSTDSPRARSARKKRAPSLKSQGAQPGHPPASRTLLPATRQLECFPQTCADCQHTLEGRDPAPLRHQFVDLPPIIPEVTDYLLHQLQCAQCGKATRATTPEHVGRSTYGPGVVSLASSLTGAFRLSKRQAKRLMSWLLGTPVSVGSICAFEHRVSQALAPSHHEALSVLRQSPVVHVDETTWWQKNGKMGWAWVGCTPKMSVYSIASTRSRKSFEKLMGEAWPGICVSDRFSVYTHRDGPGQWCLSHLLRDFEAASSRAGPVGMYARDLAAMTRVMFRLHRWHKAGEEGWVVVSRQALVECGREIRKRFDVCLEAGAEEPDAPRWFRQLAKQQEGLWRWLEHEGVEVSNNLAEREIRPLVLARKTSFGTQSEKGDRFIERLYTVVGTLKKEGRHVLNFLRDSLTASESGQPVPLLLPA